jgi:hypothetical protein
MENQIAVINNSMEVFKTAPEILLNHQARVSKAMTVADDIIKQWEETLAIPDPEARFAQLNTWDVRANKFLANCGAASVEMKSARSAITQLMDMLREMYTKEENTLDPKKGEKIMVIQASRNNYAKLALAESERKKKEAADKAAKEKEEVEIRTSITATISQKLIDNLADKKLKMSQSFNNITLENFAEKSVNLRSLDPVFPTTFIGEIRNQISFRWFRHSEAELAAISNAEFEVYDFDGFQKKYVTELVEFKQSLIDRLPSKKAELDEAKRVADKLEQDRKEELERQQVAEKKRQEAILKANEEERDRLQKQAEIDREKDAQKIKYLEENAEIERLGNLRIQEQRQKDELTKIGDQAQADKLKSEQDADLKRTAGSAMALFNEVTDISNSATPPEVRTGIEISVSHVTGWVELFQYWFTQQGITMALSDVEKMTFAKLKGFAEKAAKDTPKKRGERIESKFITYSDTLSSVNRKQKVNA